jgi:coproporphyrinogen III oxidase-like Fe-S oxidoreductase
VDPFAEITLEMDPGTFSYDRLLALRDIGVNRISMGVQSFDNAMLKHCGRPHTVEDTYQALDDLHRAGWENFSIDLISSLPFLTPELWADTLLQAAKCGSSHISVYDLQVEPRTAFARRYRPGMHPLPTEEASAQMYRTAVHTLTGAGFEHYEVSNYARPGRRSRHNLKYWRCDPVLGFGMSAASYVGGERSARPKTMQEYTQYVQKLPSESTLPLQQAAVTALSGATHTVTVPDMLDTVMLSLRTGDGLDLEEFSRLYGAENAARVSKALDPYQQQGLALYSNTEGSPGGGGNSVGVAFGRVRLADPDGFIVSNDIISSVFAALPTSDAVDQ